MQVIKISSAHRWHCSIGATWLGLVISCSFALLLLLFAFSWVGR